MLDLDELVDGLLQALQRAVPSDWVSINDVGPDPEGTIAVVIPEEPEDLHEIYGELALQNPLAARYAETGDGRPYRISDVVTTEEFQALEIYQRLYGPMGVEYQIAFILPGSPGRILGIALSRRHNDYSDDERDLLLRARPFLIQAWRNALEHTALRDELRRRPFSDSTLDDTVAAALRERGLTERQAEVLWLVARGRSSQDTAAVLGLSDRTVQKHLERCYRVLEVTSRSEASTLVWSLLAPPPSGNGDGAAPPRRSGLERP
jgi:DNA-binding CsgD family transcriptional regulator